MEINVYPYEGEDEHVVVDSDPSGRFERYQKCLGMGAFKRVYLAFDTEEGMEVAWNELRLGHLQKKDIVNVLSEVQILQQIRHENIINLYHSWVSNSQIYFITELMTSGTLKSFIKKTSSKSGIKPKIIKNWCRQILRGLTYLHSLNPVIIHRDLKCENIFINGNNGQAKIGDFGLATVKDRVYASSVIGTPEFMAPELYDEKYDEKVDIYSFGLCVLEMVTREYPYCECSNQAQIYRKVTNKIKPASLDKITDADVRQFIELCIEFNPEDRPSAAQLLEHAFLQESQNSQQLQPPAGSNSSVPSSNTISSALSSPSHTASSTISTPLTSEFPSLHQSISKISPISDTSSSTVSHNPNQHRMVHGTSASYTSSNIISIESLRFQFPNITIRMICLVPTVPNSDDVDHTAPSSQKTGKQEVKFPFNLEQDTPESVVDEMIKEGVLTIEDRFIGVLWISRILESIMRDNRLFGDNSTTVSSAESSEHHYETRTRHERRPVSMSAPPQPQHPIVPSQQTHQIHDSPKLRVRSRSITGMDVSARLRSISSPSSANRLELSDQYDRAPVRPSNEVGSSSYPSSPVSLRRTPKISRRTRSIGGVGPSSIFNPVSVENLKLIPPSANSNPRSISPRRTASLQSPDTAADMLKINVDTGNLEQLSHNLSAASLPAAIHSSSQVTSQYHRALEEKTNEILEGVYRSQFRRPPSQSHPGQSLPAAITQQIHNSEVVLPNSDPNTPIVGSGLYTASASTSKRLSPPNGLPLAQTPSAISFQLSPDVGSDIVLPKPAIHIAEQALQAISPAASVAASEVEYRPSIIDPEMMMIDIQALKERQRREADELAKIHAVELLRLLHEHKQNRASTLQSEEEALHIPPSFYTWEEAEQLEYLERELLGNDFSTTSVAPLTKSISHVNLPDLNRYNTTSSDMYNVPSSFSDTSLVTKAQLSEDAERQLVALQSLALSDFDREVKSLNRPATGQSNFNSNVNATASSVPFNQTSSPPQTSTSAQDLLALCLQNREAETFTNRF